MAADTSAKRSQIDRFTMRTTTAATTKTMIMMMMMTMTVTLMKNKEEEEDDDDDEEDDDDDDDYKINDHNTTGCRICVSAFFSPSFFQSLFTWSQKYKVI